ncbi:protein phosphatase 2C domain-containing protein [Acidiferrimicrobium sp. IK]|uniref:protein phosphatase 2C domain-containing protein n=1 Tax=Acidiferrimicrobium sp. IK TaxID=2871700 RepID=UPI0021CB1099|nr:protein phosphatase 2C domain-containing protein [Acidiferrimicrobium sp. IK]MCU4183982.1 protein phosphatase 2C domain-containing protein [Acidiferrimicrobium sp. IK]
MRADGGDSGSWIVRAASLSGTRHRLAGAGPDDAYAWGAAGEMLVVAVADGVSNRPGSAASAAAAVEAAVEAAIDADRDERLGVLEHAVAAASDATRRCGDGATTLVIAVLDASTPAILARVGDSSAFVLTGGAWTEVWAPDPDAGSIRTATAALPADRPSPEPAQVWLGPGDVLVLVTDGVADPIRDGPTTVAPGLAAALAAPPEPLELARLVDFSRQGVHDDRTLIAVWPAAGGSQAVAEDGPAA